MGYDTKCHELAVTFLTDEKVEGPLLDRTADDLAQQIQDLIESFIEYDLVEMRKEAP
jgi:hypothetical protein